MSTDFQALRREYRAKGLLEGDVLADPLEQLARWLADAVAAEVREPNAMTLATVGADGAPSARVVLLKGLDARGLAFYTHTASRKGRELAGEPRAALLFYWPDLERQVRLEGDVAPVADAEADAYFASRPRAARLSALASEQSRPIAGRAALEARFAAEAARHEGAEAIPRPATWGGYRLSPRRVELWQGRPDRLHDRILYEREAPDSPWRITRLQP